MPSVILKKRKGIAKDESAEAASKTLIIRCGSIRVIANRRAKNAPIANAVRKMTKIIEKVYTEF